MRALRSLGHRAEAFNPFGDLQFATRAAEEADVVVFSKPLQDERGSFDRALGAYREILRRCLRARVVLDLNDDHFESPAFRSFYGGQGGRAWVASTPDMGRVIEANVPGAAPVVIGDPYEGPEGIPAPPLPTRFPRLFRFLDRFAAAGSEPWRLALLWFGHPAGFGELERLFPQLEALGRQFPLHLQVLSAPGIGLETACGEQDARAPDRLRVAFAPWSTEVTWRALRACDLVLLPASWSTRRARVKSANRLLEALRAGRYAVCDPLPAYEALGAFASVGPSIPEGVSWALNHPAQALARVRAGQEHIAQTNSPAAVAQAWLRVFNMA